MPVETTVGESYARHQAPLSRPPAIGEDCSSYSLLPPLPFAYRRASPFMVIPGGVSGTFVNPHFGDMQ